MVFECHECRIYSTWIWKYRKSLEVMKLKVNNASLLPPVPPGTNVQQQNLSEQNLSEKRHLLPVRILCFCVGKLAAVVNLLSVS